MELFKRHESIRAYDKVVRSTCAFCPSGCGVKIYLKGEEIVDLWGEEDHPLNKGSLCGKGSAAVWLIDHPQRIRTPLARRTRKDKFHRLTWNDALDLVVRRLSEIVRKYGPESVVIQTSDPLDFTGNLCAQRSGRLMKTPNVILPIMDESPSAASAARAIFGTKGHGVLMNPPYDWSHSRCIFVVGSEFSTTDVVTMGWIIDAKERGAKIVAIDTKFTPLLAKADLPLQPKPGTEVALLMALSHILIQKNHYEGEFVKRWVQGFEDWAEACKHFTPEKVAELRWVPEEKIRKAAELAAKNFPIQILGMNKVQDPRLSALLVKASAGLLTLSGAIGVPGGGLNMLGAAPPICGWAGLEAFSPPDRPSVIASNESLYEAMEKGKPYPIKAILWDGNPLAQLPNVRKFREALNKVDLIVHLSFFPNLSQECSHFVFPMASWLECEGLISAGNSRALQWHNQAIPPREECRSSGDFWIALADRLGCPEYFQWRREDGLADIRTMTDFFLHQESLTQGCSVDQIDPEKAPLGGILWPCIKEEEVIFEDGAPQRGKGILFRPKENYPGEEKRFPTLSGKVELLGPGEETPSLQMFIEPKGLDTGEFPLILTVGRPVNYFDFLGYCLEGIQDTQPPLHVQINPKTAELLGVQNGDSVVVENAEGSIEGQAWTTETVDERCVWCPAGTDECLYAHCAPVFH